MASSVYNDILTWADLNPNPLHGHDFYLFSCLPAEIRIKIWEHGLQQRERIIKTCLYSRYLMDFYLDDQKVTRPETMKGEGYSVVVDGYQTLSKFFRINREARSVASSFYRVHLPCWLIKGVSRSRSPHPGILYFNPEHDFLHIKTKHCGLPYEANHYAQLFHDIKTIHDPRHIGLLNLAVDRRCLLEHGLCSMIPSQLSPQVRATLTETLAQLRQLFFVQIETLGRVSLGMVMLAPVGKVLNPAFPVTGMALNFYRLSQDPRPMGQCLDKVFLTCGPEKMIQAWPHILHKLLDNPEICQPEQRVLLTTSLSYRKLYNHHDAVELLQKQEDIWKNERSGYNYPDLDLGKGFEATLKTAVGFWLFPISAFDPPPRDAYNLGGLSSSTFVDLSAQQPELGLLSLS